jgi:hypothetical protein
MKYKNLNYHHSKKEHNTFVDLIDTLLGRFDDVTLHRPFRPSYALTTSISLNMTNLHRNAHVNSTVHTGHMNSRTEGLLLFAVNSVINFRAFAISEKRFLLNEERDTSNTTLATLLLETWTKYVLEPSVQVSRTGGFHSVLCTTHDSKLSISFLFMILSTVRQGPSKL